MATIQYTKYTFQKPSLIDENSYNIIKLNLKNTPNYKPFPMDSFWEKFKISILSYIVGGPIAIILGSLGIGFLEVISSIYALGLFGGCASIMPEWISYLKFLRHRKYYFSRLIKKLEVSKNYIEFKDLMV